MKKRIISIVAIIALVAVLGVCLAACNASSYEKKLEKNGYEVTVSDKDSEEVKEMNEYMAESGDYSGKIKWVVTGIKADVSLSGIDAGMVTITKFSKTADAKKYVEEAGGESDEVVRKGSIVIIGDKASVDLVA